jgi:hypothetical protein
MVASFPMGRTLRRGRLVRILFLELRGDVHSILGCAQPEGLVSRIRHRGSQLTALFGPLARFNGVGHFVPPAGLSATLDGEGGPPSAINNIEGKRAGNTGSIEGPSPKGKQRAGASARAGRRGATRSRPNAPLSQLPRPLGRSRPR